MRASVGKGKNVDSRLFADAGSNNCNSTRVPRSYFQALLSGLIGIEGALTQTETMRLFIFLESRRTHTFLFFSLLIILLSNNKPYPCIQQQLLSSLMIRLGIKNFNFVRNTKFCFGQVSKITDSRYPYKFGGIDKTNHAFDHLMVIKRMFGPDVLTGFQQAYLAILGALKDKDKSFLQTNLESQLANNIEFQQVEFVNENSPIEISTNKMLIAVGGHTKRTAQNKKWTPVKNTKDGFDLFFVNEAMKNINSISFLLGCEVCFKSKAKLIEKDHSQNRDIVETHSVQFEVSNNLGMMELFSIMQLLRSDQSQNIQKIFEALIGKNYEWKIGDIDRTLNGNFEVQKDGLDLGKFM